jgi:hypothetical protein
MLGFDEVLVIDPRLVATDAFRFGLNQIREWRRPAGEDHPGLIRRGSHATVIGKGTSSHEHGCQLLGSGIQLLFASQRNRRYVMAQTKGDRSAAAKKAAATRERNRSRAQSAAAGKKGAGTRQSRAAEEAASQAKRAAGSAVSSATSALRLIGKAAKQAGKAAATKASGARDNQKK